MGRTLALSDVHGNSKTFHALLEKIHLTPADTLYILGDVIDRGLDTKLVINTILKLESDGFDIRPVLGNHEDLMLTGIRSEVFEDLLEWLENGGDTTLKSYDVPHPSHLPEKHLRFLEKLPLYRVTGQFVLVHAGIDCALADPFSKAGRHQMLWDRTGEIDIDKLGGRRVVCGHSVRNFDEIRKSLAGNLIRIDNGVYVKGVPGKGNLLCVNLETNEIFIQPNIDAV